MRTEVTPRAISLLSTDTLPGATGLALWATLKNEEDEEEVNEDNSVPALDEVPRLRLYGKRLRLLDNRRRPLGNPEGGGGRRRWFFKKDRVHD